MAKGDKLIVYGIGIFTLSALLLAWMSHSGRAGSKAEHPSAAGIPVMGASPSEAPAPSTTEGSPSPSANQPMATPEERHSSTESDARPADRPARSQADIKPRSLQIGAIQKIGRRHAQPDALFDQRDYPLAFGGRHPCRQE